MTLAESPSPVDAIDEIATLIEALHVSERRLEELTGGEVDTVADRTGRTFLLRRAQEQVRLSEAGKQAAILNALPAHIALLDPRGVILSVNQAWRRFGDTNALQSPDCAISMNYLEVCDLASGDYPAEARQVANGIRSVLRGDVKNFSLEYPCHSATEQRWFLMAVTPLPGNPPTGAVVMHVNVTAERQTEESLRVSESRFRQMAEHIQDVFFLCEADGSRMLYVSQAYEEIWLRRCESLYANPQSWSDAIHPDDRPAAQEKAMSGGKFKQEFRIVRPDGSIRWIESKGYPVHDDAGRIVRIAGIAKDITAHKLAQDRIAYLNRVYVMLSGINGLLVHVRSRDELYNDACRIAVEGGGFRMAWIASVDRKRMKIELVASVGLDATAMTALKARLSLSGGTPLGRSRAARAIAEKKAIVTNHLIGNPDVSLGHFYEERNIHSMIMLPLIVANEGVGTLALYAREDEFFREEELKLLTELAGDISFALEHIGKEEKIARLSRITAFTSEINSLIVRIRGRQELFDEVCRVAIEHGRFGTAWIGIFDSVTLAVTSATWTDGPTKRLVMTLDNEQTDVANGSGVVARALRTGRPVVENDLASDPLVKSVRRAEAVGAGLRSLIALPFVIEGLVVGHLSLYSTELDFFDGSEVRLLTELAANISFALDHIGKEEKIARLSRIRAFMSNINTLIVRADNRNELFEEACRVAVEHGKFGIAWIGALDHETLIVTPIAWAGDEAEALSKVKSSAREDLPAGKGAVGRAIHARHVVFNNGLHAGGYQGPRLTKALQLGYRSQITLPLFNGEAIFGTLSLYARESGFFNEDEIKLLVELAGDLSFALDRFDKKEKLDYLAYYDVLTGLSNRSLFLERVTQYMQSAVSGGHPLALFLIDLERFRNINDSLGRPAGDAMLKLVAAWLVRNAGDAKLVARLGADHFAAVMPVVQQEGDVARLLEKTVTAFLGHPFRLEDSVYRLALKIGVALFPDDGADADTLLRNAEAALKRAKARGERYLFYTQKMTDTLAGKLSLENQLRQALDNEEFVLHYQPKVNLASGKLVGAEALIRWNDPRTGLVPPGRFIPILEETGLIYEVGRWALRKAIADYLHWHAAGLPAPRIAVNMSPLQLRNRGFIDDIKQVIDIDTQAAAGLELEITESLIMEDVKHSITSLQSIRDMGICIAIDDFGTGFSSLSYLSKLPVDVLKIDRSFVVDMMTGPEGLALVSTIINLAHSLKIKVVAEGVETEEQSRLLRLLSCDEFQGFLFSKPVPRETFEARFLASTPAG